MIKYLIFILIIFILSCNLFEPSYLLIKNSSNYKISVNCINSDKNKIDIEKEKSNYLLVYPGEQTIKVYVHTIQVKREYKLYFAYHEKKELEFKLE